MKLIKYIWHHFLRWLGLHQNPNYLSLELRSDLRDTLFILAETTGESKDKLAEEVFATGLDYYNTRDSVLKIWKELTPRECDITTLTCLGYTNPQMASKLGISVETVKTHVSNTLRKFNFHSKADLRVNLANWDFSPWLKQMPEIGGKLSFTHGTISPNKVNTDLP